MGLIRTSFPDAYDLACSSMHNYRIHALHLSTPRITHSRKRHLTTSKVGDNINKSKLHGTVPRHPHFPPKPCAPAFRSRSLVSPNRLPSIAKICNPGSTRKEAFVAWAGLAGWNARPGLPAVFLARGFALPFSRARWRSPRFWGGMMTRGRCVLLHLVTTVNS